MPWSVKKHVAGCDGYAVVKNGEVVSCHVDKATAEAHVRALYAREPARKAVRVPKSKVVAVVPENSLAKQILDSVEADDVTLTVTGEDGSYDLVMTFDKADTFKPPQAVQAAARRAQQWIRDGFAGDGFTNVGRARAAQLANGDSVSYDVVRRMVGYFIRHVNDPKADRFDDMQKPSPGRVAWDAWGGYAGRDWANGIVRRYKNMEKDAMGELDDRQSLMYQAYELIADSLGEWTQEEAHYIAADDNVFASKGMMCQNCCFYEEGACEIVAGDIEPEGLCKLWVIPQETLDAATEGDVMKDSPTVETVHVDAVMGSGRRSKRVKPNGKPMFVEKADERRYTLGPMYVPDRLDAHGEWTDADELQPAVWDYVKAGDRQIRLQHNRDVVAGEWVEIMTWPHEVTVPMHKADGGASSMSFPANTVFMGIVWEPWAWDLIKSGRLRGLSIGGKTGKILADLPQEGE